MAVFACAGCGSELTAPVSRMALPVYARQTFGHELLPALMEPGTYAVDPEPSGPPWREATPAEAAARGVFAPVHRLSFGAPGAVVVAPGDTRGTVLMLDRCDGYCLGVAGYDGPNLACARCGLAVATRVDDCSYWQAVWLEPNAVRRLPVEDPALPVADWATLPEGMPPVEQSGAWNPRWPAAAGAALAHLLVASDGHPVAVPDGLVSTMFGRALEALLPPGPPVKRVGLAGPGLPEPTDIALVPLHPRTGEAWQPSDGVATVPLAAEVWTYLAFHRDRLPVPATGGLPDGVLRDDPLPRHPWLPFRPLSSVFLHTLARLPAVREPWPHGVYDRVRARPHADPF